MNLHFTLEIFNRRFVFDQIVLLEKIKTYAPVTETRDSSKTVYKNFISDGIEYAQLPSYDDKLQICKPKENKNIKYDATVIIIMIKEKKVYLTKRLETCETYKNFYCVAGGKLELKEDPLTAAIRELKEETGLDIEPSRFEFVEASDKEPTAKVEYVFKVWLRPGEIPENTEPHKHEEWISYPIADALQLKLIPKLKSYFEDMLKDA